MKHFQQTDIQSHESVDPVVSQDHETTIQTVMMNDRGLPRWAALISLLFSVASAVCVAGIAIVAILFQSLVAQNGDVFGTLPFLALGMVPVIGLYVLEFAQVKAFAGLQKVQQSVRLRTGAIAGLLIILALAFVHPLLILPTAVSVAVGAACMALAVRFGRWHPAWEFSPAEAVSILSGRDAEGFTYAQSQPVAPAALTALKWFIPACAIVLSVALGSWMVAQSILMLPALIAVAGLSFWASVQIATFLLARFINGASADPHHAPTVVDQTDVPPAFRESCNAEGLIVHGLTVSDANGARLLSDLRFNLAPGTIVAVTGAAACGKSVLARALVNPFSIAGASVTGAVQFRDQSLWQRSTRDMGLYAGLIAETPLILAQNGAANAMAFQSDGYRDRARRCLESIVFSSEVVDRILGAPDATRLSMSDQRRLELSRMFFLAPFVMVLDRPENHCDPATVRALAARLQQERRAGRIVILVTEDRALLEICDRMMVLQNGRIIDHGPAAEILGRTSTGWARFVCDQRLESEDVLTDWVRSHFKRKGDEGNRDTVAAIAAELLAFSCQDIAPVGTEKIDFDFKHYQGHCVLKLTDTGRLLSSGQIQRAQRASLNEKGSSMTPLGAVLRGALGFEQVMEDGKRTISLTIKTYDPRLTGGSDTAPAPRVRETA